MPTNRQSGFVNTAPLIAGNRRRQVHLSEFREGYAALSRIGRFSSYQPLGGGLSYIRPGMTSGWHVKRGFTAEDASKVYSDIPSGRRNRDQ